MKKYKEIQKGFTLIELLMVVALIAILSTVILMSLDSGRERAELNRYFSYGTQMHRLSADAAAAGKFDQGKIGSSVTNSALCLSSECSGDIDDWDYDDDIKAALTYLTEMPVPTAENSQSPYNSSEGVTITYKPGTGASQLNVVRITMYLVADHGDFVERKCDAIGWSTNIGQNSCYMDVKLHSRL